MAQSRRRANMLTKWLCTFCAFGMVLLPSTSVDGFLLEYQNELANISAQVVREVAASWTANSELNGLFNRNILAQIGDTTVQMRIRDAYVAALLENERDDLSDVCWVLLDEYYSFYRSIWGVDLQNCMREANQDLEYDRLNRFRPQASSVQRIMPSATYQVIRTLSMSDIFNAESIRAKLADEQQSYRNTWEFYETALQDELARHDEIVTGTMTRMNLCLDRALVYQQLDIEVIEEEIQTNCDTETKKV
uniref:Protein TsetseEP domain-containing protein n=1 Tax=Anopheles christyi TaxID=43041 RepID=A0A182KJ89_9DIPT